MTDTDSSQEQEAQTPKPTEAPAPKKGRRALTVLLVLGVLGGEFASGAQNNPRFVPLAVDVLRAVVGPEAVAKLEDEVYTAKDKVQGWKSEGEAPKTYWDNNDAEAPMLLSAPGQTGQVAVGDASAAFDGAADGGVPVAAFPPPAYTPPFPQIAAKNDGLWYGMTDDAEGSSPTELPVMAKSLVHPDPKRPYTAVAIVAIDLTRTSLHLVAGSEEPASDVVKHKDRPGRIPDSDHARLVAAFNGGWQAVHGHFGMMIDGAQFLPPKDKCCTVALYKDGSLSIAPWTALSSTSGDMFAYRQTPPCLREGGSHHSLLQDSSKNWGAAVDGATVIRRSAIGIDKAKKVLYYGVGDSLTALTIAEALGYAGAWDVAELDVNAAFPRFLTYSHAKEHPTVKESLIPALYKPGEYATLSWYRDFFYLTRKGPAKAP
jgi:hypothetical protein